MTSKSQDIPTLKTLNLTLRPFQAGDAPVLHRINQADGVLQYFPVQTPPALDRVERFLNGQLAHWERYSYGNWAIVPDGAGEMAGWAGLQYLPELGETEVGFLLDRPWWGKGLATQAALASLEFGFTHCGMDHIIALVHPENTASLRVVEKCGMQVQETLELWGIVLVRYKIDARTHPI